MPSMYELSDREAAAIAHALQRLLTGPGPGDTGRGWADVDMSWMELARLIEYMKMRERV